MKILIWLQNKLNGRHGSRKPSMIPSTDHILQEPQFTDRHHGLLAIGTLGNSNLKEDPRRSNLEGNSSSSQYHLQELTPQELEKLQSELNFLVHKQDGSTCSTESEATNHQLDKLLAIQSSLTSNQSDESSSKDGSLQRSTTIVLNRGKDVCSENAKDAIGKKPLSFLLKKMFACGSGLVPPPSLRDPLTESRMQKILRAILHKKIYPQSSSTAASMKKYLKDRQMPKSTEDNELHLKEDNGSKWVNTDSEYIVLEI